jgi:hypothetical protein
MEASSGLTPFLRDRRPKAFTFGFLAVDEDGAWVADSYYPLLIRLDGRSGQIEGPIELKDVPRHEQQGSQAIRCLAVGRGAVWCVFRDEMVRYLPETGAQARFPLSGDALAAGAEGIWTGSRGYVRDGEVMRAASTVLRRLDESDGRITPFDYSGRLLTLMALGHEAVWVATHSQGTTRTTTLIRIDPNSGEVKHELELSGMARQLWIDDARVWILTRAALSSELEAHLIGIDPDDMQIVSDVKDPPIYEGALYDGEIWTQSQFGEPKPGEMAGVRRLDPVTGRSLGEIRLSRRPRALNSGGDGVWADQISGAAKLSTEGPVAEFRTDGLHVPEHLLPPPPPEIQAEEWEARIRDQVAASLAGHAKRKARRPGTAGRQSRYEDIDFVSTELLGSFPTTWLAVYFRVDEHPDVLIGRRWRLWEPDGGTVDFPLDGMRHLSEDLDNRVRPILPVDAVADERGIVWI